MSGGSEDDGSDEGDGGRPEEGKILSPEELDIADDEHVTELEEGRYVVSPEVRPEEERRSRPATTAESDRQDAEQGDRDGDSARPPESVDRGDGRQRELSGSEGDGTTTREAAHRSLRASFADSEPRYGFDVTAAVEGSVDQRRMVSNDVVTIFESLVVWYAQQIDSETPVEEILGILLMEASVPVRYPSQSLQRLVRSTELGPEDTIGNLYDAIAEDGLEF